MSQGRACSVLLAFSNAPWANQLSWGTVWCLWEEKGMLATGEAQEPRLCL